MTDRVRHGQRAAAVYSYLRCVRGGLGNLRPNLRPNLTPCCRCLCNQTAITIQPVGNSNAPENAQIHNSMPITSGRHFLQIPGPTNVPDRVLRAMAAPTIDHRGPQFGRLTGEILDGLKQVFETTQPVMVFPGSGTGAWEAALVNTLSPGNKVLAFETGHFATQWSHMATALGLDVELVPGDWRGGVDPAVLEQKLAEDDSGAIRAVMVVHNETSTGVTSRIDEIRKAMDSTGHPGLLLVDTISSLGCTDYRHDEWGVDVTVCGSQKGLMLPPGLGFNAISEKALAASRTAQLQKSYWDWGPMRTANEAGFFPTLPRQICCLAFVKRCECFSTKGCGKFSSATTVWRKRHGGRFALGDSKSCAGIRKNTATA